MSKAHFTPEGKLTDEGRKACEAARIPDFQFHYVERIGPNSWTKCLPAMGGRAIYSTVVNMLTHAEFYAPSDETAIEFFIKNKPVNSKRLIKIQDGKVVDIYLAGGE